MTKHRMLARTLSGLLMALIAAPALAAPAPTPAQRAGAISALLPVARIIRGAGKAQTSSEAKKGDELIWNDLVRTEKGGRARVTLLDQSILSLGSQAELRVAKHDARNQQTQLQLQYGRLRAEVSQITRSGGSFEMRTPTAVAGVIGTDFGTDSGIGQTTFLCISGAVQVSNSDPAVLGSVQCAPGMTTSVAAGKPPTPPVGATPEQIQQLIQDTEPAEISAMSSVSALAGATVDTTLTGSKMTGLNKVSASGSGVQVSLAQGGTDTAVTLHVVVAASAAPGPRTFTLTKPNGAASAAVFTILAPPAPPPQGTDPKKPYHDVIEQERQSARAGLTAFVAQAQQASDQATQALQLSNQNLPQPLDLSQATNGLASQVAAVQQAVNSVGAQIDQAAATADAAFDAAYTAANNALLQRNPNGAPDDAFNQAVQAAFQQANGAFGVSLTSLKSALSAAVQTAGQAIAQLQANWLAQINAAALAQQVGPTPKLNGTERTADVGAIVGAGTISSFDASRSTALGNATIASYRWVLCDSSYKPPQFGIPIPPNTPGCNPLPGYQSGAAEFVIPTCNLVPNDYVARVIITDNNNKVTAMDAKVHVLPPTYDDPTTRVRNLAAAYMALQPTQFLAFFDENNFPGFVSLQENIRNTFPTLASMNINVVPSQASINCNDATVRADWFLNYSFKATPGVQVPTSHEQLSVRMTRTPGKGWYITDFQGDNGTVPPGPVIVEAAVQPDLEIIQLFASSVAGSNLVSGQNTIFLEVENIGNADVAQDTTVHLDVVAGGNTLASADIPVPAPVAKSGGFKLLSTTITLPAGLTSGTPVQLNATINPGCGGASAVPESDCSNNSAQTLSQVGTTQPNYVITNFTFAGHSAPFTGVNALQVGETTANGLVTVTNIGNASPVGTLTLTASCSSTTVVLSPNDCTGVTITLPAPPAGSSAQGTFPFGSMSMPVGLYTGTVNLTTPIVQSSTADDTLSLPFEVADFQLVATNPFTPAQNIRLNFNGQIPIQLTETGNVTAFPIPITVTPAVSGLSYFMPSPLMTPGTTQAVSVFAGAAAPGVVNLVITGTNHGVTKSVTQPVNLYDATIQSTNLFLNDASHPLEIQKGLPSGNPCSSAPLTPCSPVVTVKLTPVAGTFSGSSTLLPPTVTGLTVTPFPSSVTLGGTTDLQISATTAAVGTVTPITIPAQIPNTFPQDSIPYVLYVLPGGVPDLAVTSIVANPLPSPANPLLAGQGFTYAVTITNSGTVASAGNENITVTMNGAQVGQASAPSLAPLGSTTVNVSAVVPDDPNLPTTSKVKVRIDPDPIGDLNYANNTLAATLDTSNWGICVGTPAGVSCSPTAGATDANPVTIQIISAGLNQGAGSAQISGFVSSGASGGFSNSSVNLIFGQLSNKVTSTSISPNILSNASPQSTASFLVADNGQVGLYFAQVVAQMVVGGNVTAQRQATIHINVAVNSTLSTPAAGTLSFACTHSSSSCTAPANVPIQINGTLTEQFTVAVTRSTCTTGPCPGSVDISFTDAANTLTTPQQLKGVPYALPQVAQITANVDPTGNVTIGPGTVNASVSAVQTSGAQLPSAGTVGTPFPIAVNVGDINVSSSSCVPVVAGATAPATLSISWVPTGGFNVPTLAWEWLDSNKVPVGPSPLTFSTPGGTSGLSGGTYTAPPLFTLTNTPAGGGSPPDGLQTYFFAVTITNGITNQTKYFPFYFDLSLAQNFCGAVPSSANGFGGGTLIHGSWSKSGVLALPALAVTRTATTTAPSGALPDLRVNSADITFMPSLPKPGDNVQFRFRVSNAGDADAIHVPIAVVVNGTSVVSDTFDVPAGHATLAELDWNNAQVPKGPPPVNRPERSARSGASPQGTPVLAAIAVDPQHSTQQKSPAEKIAPVPRFTMGVPVAAGPVAGLNSQRVLLEIGEGGCIAFRLASGGTAPCGSGDVDLTVEDVGKGTYSLSAAIGVADVTARLSTLGSALPTATQLAGASFSSQAAGVAGHVYAVQLRGGQVGLLVLDSIRSPQQLDARARALFRRLAIRVLAALGSSTGAVESGDTSGGQANAPTVFMEIRVVTP